VDFLLMGDGEDMVGVRALAGQRLETIKASSGATTANSARAQAVQENLDDNPPDYDLLDITTAARPSVRTSVAVGQYDDHAGWRNLLLLPLRKEFRVRASATSSRRSSG
jgi:hypothetical protein